MFILRPNLISKSGSKMVWPQKLTSNGCGTINFRLSSIFLKQKAARRITSLKHNLRRHKAPVTIIAQGNILAQYKGNNMDELRVGTGQISEESCLCFAVYFLPKNLRLPLDSMV